MLIVIYGYPKKRVKLKKIEIIIEIYISYKSIQKLLKDKQLTISYITSKESNKKMESIILPANFDVSSVSYSAPRTLDNGGRSIYLSLNRSPIVLQTPEMVAPYGISNFNDDGKGPDRYSLDLSFKGKDERENIKTFFEKMSALDKKLINDGVENSMTWLKKKYNSVDVVEALYSTMVKYAKDKTTGEITDKYPPTFKLKLPMYNGAFACEAYDTKRNVLDIHELIRSNSLKGAKVTAIVQCVGIWVVGTKFGCSWKVLQMRVAMPQAIKGYAFKELEEDKVDDSDIEDDDSVVNDEPVNTATAQINNLTVADDSDDELIESSEDELDAPVQKKETKKRVAKK
jgi:hypothetical protein